ncbi:helix-turn-helix transcriptional regulator [Actinomycetospora sp. C-140]
MTEGVRSRPAVAAAPFVGRDDELATLRRLCAADRLVTVLGPGGSGKTRLASEVLPTVAPVVLGVVELATRVPGDDLWSVVLAACDLRDDPAASPVDRLAHRIGDLAGERDALLVLDNCEHVRDAVAELAGALLSRAPRVRILATSRLSLGVPGETTLPVEGLAVPAATALFLDRARRVRPDLPDAEETTRRARRIAIALDGLPLALELAAARARGLPLRVIEDGTAHRLAFLDAGPAGGAREPRHRSLQACLSWSTALLTDRTRAGLAALAAVEGRCSLDAAVAAVGPPRAPGEADAVAVIEELVDHSLVRFAPDDGGSYLVLETVREHARELVADERRRALARLTPWVAALAARARPALERADLDVLARLDGDAAAIRAVLSPTDGRAGAVAADVVADLAFWWSLRGRCREGLDRAARLSAARADAGEPVGDRLRWAHAFLALYGGDVETGLGLAVAVAEDPAAADDVRGRAMILLGMAQGFDDPAGAAPVLTGAAELALAAGDRWGRVEALQVLAYTHLWLGDAAAALAAADAARPALDELGHHQLRAWDDAIRAEVASLRADVAEALAHGRAGHALAVGIGEPLSATCALLPAVRALCRTGRVDEAAGLVRAHGPFLDDHPGLGAVEALDACRAHVALWSHPPGPVDALAGSLEQWAEQGLTLIAAEVGGVLAVALLAAGNPGRALALADAARTRAHDRGARELGVAAGLAHAAARRAQGGDVAADAHDALAAGHEGGFTIQVLDALALVAGVALDAGHVTTALRLHAALETARRARGLAVSPLARAVLAGGTVDTAAATLDEAERERALQEGSSLDLDGAVAYARRARGARGRPRSGWDSLTPTERDVVVLAARGLRNQAIADQLLIGTGTVRTHLRRIFTKLDLTSRSELAAAAARRGM